jgi:hypothetical protein
MSTQSIDTSPEAEKFLISLIRKASLKQKFRQIQSLSSFVRNLSMKAIQRANPDLSKVERDILFVQLHYGNDLAEKLREYLKRNHYE